MISKNFSKINKLKFYRHHDFIFWDSIVEKSETDGYRNEFLIWDFYTLLKFKKFVCKGTNKFEEEKIFEYGYTNCDDDIGNPLCNLEYFSVIASNTQKMERKFMPRPDYIKYQPDINVKMRAILVDWLIDVHNKFKLFPKTLFLAVNIIDRFLTLRSISRQKLQLLGIAAMLIASKYEEVYAPETKDFVYISDSAYTKEDIFKMESLICNTLKYDFSSPSLLNLLSFNLKKNEEKRENIFFSWYFIELILLEYCILKYPPSIVISTIMVFVRELLVNYYEEKFSQKNLKIQKKVFANNKYSEDCQNILKSIAILNQNERHRLTANKRKFLAKKYGEISVAIYSIHFL
nr:cyclin B [Cryptomonas sp.]